ncbi:MAG: 4Fe-4S binding protein [Treponema sp.]
MISSILFLILFTIVLSAFLFFLFCILFPSLKAQKINAEDPLYSREELELITANPHFAHIDTGLKAIVLCSSQRKFSEKRFSYNGEKDCTIFVNQYETENECTWGCTGFGNCMRSCPRQAINIENSTAVINENCNGCGICISVCPKHLITLIPENVTKYILCKAPENENNICTKYRDNSDLNRTQKKGFNFWKKCYKIFNRK